MALNKRYELIETDVLNEVCEALREAKRMTEDKHLKLLVVTAHNNIQKNRKQCNVRPASEE